MAVSNSILTSIKDLLGIEEDMINFDTDITMHINSVFFTLEQIGVNPGTFFSITDKTTMWDDFILIDQNLQVIKSYMYFKVRLMFDPPISGALVELMKVQTSELEWRIMVSVDPKPIVIVPDIVDEEGITW